jgi:hypothetical protein
LEENFMCNIPLIGSLIIVAQLSFMTAIALVTRASQLNGNIFRAGGAPFLMIAAVIFVTGAITALALAGRQLAACAVACPAQAARLAADIIALSTALGTLVIAIGAATLVAGIPFAGGIAIAGILVALGLAGIISSRLTADFAALSTCAAAAPMLPPPVNTIVTVLGTLLTIAIGAAIVGGLATGLLPLIPFPRG